MIGFFKEIGDSSLFSAFVRRLQIKHAPRALGHGGGYEISETGFPRQQGKLKGIYRQCFPDAAMFYDARFRVHKASIPDSQPQWWQHWPQMTTAAHSRSSSPLPCGIMTCGIRGMSRERKCESSNTELGSAWEKPPEEFIGANPWTGMRAETPGGESLNQSHRHGRSQQEECDSRESLLKRFAALTRKRARSQ